MNYYEELGVAETATEEEIRRAYKKLARVLHPDQYQDEELRRICERQMARLNAIAEVLGDPVRRREYDERDYAPEPRRERRAGVEKWVWVGAAALGLGAMMWFFRPQAEGVEARRYRPEAAEKARPVAQVEAKERRVVRPRRAAPEATREEVEEAVKPVVRAEERVKVEERGLKPAPRAEATVREERVKPAVQGLAGRWFFAREASERDKSLYEPVMIELAIAEEGGVLRGKYMGRYRVPDRPISPAVSFVFSGPAEAGEYAWEGAGGAAGRVRLKAVTPLSMEVSWWATEMGAMDLASGTATLIRAQERF